MPIVVQAPQQQTALYVTNLPKHTTKAQIIDFMAGVADFGLVSAPPRIVIMRDSTASPTASAIVEFLAAKTADEVRTKMDYSEMLYRKTRWRVASNQYLGSAGPPPKPVVVPPKVIPPPPKVGRQSLILPKPQPPKPQSPPRDPWKRVPHPPNHAPGTQPKNRRVDPVTTSTATPSKAIRKAPATEDDELEMPRLPEPANRRFKVHDGPFFAPRLVVPKPKPSCAGDMWKLVRNIEGTSDDPQCIVQCFESGYGYVMPRDLAALHDDELI